MVREFVLQWHISESCNLKCLHCYQEGHVPVSLNSEQLFDILNQYRQLLKEQKIKGHINITGGEPLCSPHFFELLEEFKKDRDLYSFSILTNGTLITDEIAKRIASYGPEYVQVSLEGSKKTNDYIRGKGVYSKVAKAVKLLKKYNVYVSLSFTATALNYKELPNVVKFAKRYGVDTVWSDRYIPLNSPEVNLCMNKEQTKEYLDMITRESFALKRQGCKTEVALYRALQFLKTNNLPYSCTAGDTLLTVMENGDLVPCRRMPIVVGNLLEDNMLDLYHNSRVLQELRDDTTPDECMDCDYCSFCKGGLKCLTYATYGDLNHKDVGCYYD